ncbi:hypothetical protein C8R43DRAFT_883906, partial [Mycena crocata]
LPLADRPPPVTKWINNGRVSKTKNIPAVPSVAKYAEGFFLWWDGLPKWRTRTDDGRWAFGGDVAYGAWMYPGQNGCLSVVAGLFIWGVCENQTPALKEEWEYAVLDVTWMLEGLALSMK